MTPAALLEKTARMGIRIEPRGDRLAVTPAARDAACWQLNSTEAQLLDTLAAFDEVAATKPAP